MLIFSLGTAAVLSLLRFILGYPLKEKRTAFYIIAGMAFALCLVSNIIIKDGESTELITELLLVGAAMALPYLLLKPQRRFTFVLFGLIICSTVDYIESLIMSFIPNGTILTGQIIYTVTYAVLLCAVMLLYRFANMRIPPDFLEKLSPTIYIVIFFADFSAYYDVTLSQDSMFFTSVSNVLKLLSAALIVGCFSYVIYRYTNLSYKQKEAELQLEAELRHYEEMVQKNMDIRTFRHDYKNNLYSIKTLISGGRIEEAEKYIDELNVDVERSENKYATGNFLADAIISGKAAEAGKLGVAIEFDGMIPEKGIANSDLCTILSNALDNAIRGCTDISPCTVYIKCEKLPNGLTVTVTNPVKERVIIKNNSVRTTKSDAKNHGIGIGNIRKAAQKYNGYADISCDKNEFRIEIGLIF